jgi:hypothetical protein
MMGTKLQDLIDAAQKLSPVERLDLITAVSQSLRLTYGGAAGPDFWEPRTLEYHIKAQETPVVAEIAELEADFWPEEETADDLIEYVYRQRGEDRLS